MSSLAFASLVSLVCAQQIPLPPLPKTLLGLETNKKPLYFDRHGNFKVVTFSDLHFGESPGPGLTDKDNRTMNVISTILDYEKPSFVVYNGDLITGEDVARQNDNITELLDECFAPTVQRGLPFSSTYGNHDNSDNLNHQVELTYEMARYGGRNGLSYSRSDVGTLPYGPANYWLPIYASKPKWWKRWWSSRRPTKPSLILWFFDSRGFVGGDGTSTPPPGPAAADYWVPEDVVPRYIRSQAALMRKTWGSLPPSLVFVHIPFKLALDLFIIADDDFPTYYGNGPVTQGGFDNDGAQNYSGLDWPTWTELVRLDDGVGKVLAVTSGHDHGESWCARSVNSSGLTQCFDGHGGYGGYVTTNGHVRNARAFQLNLRDLSRSYPTALTYNTYENMTRNDFVQLSQQYLAGYN